jgi:hypothetical protein
VRVAYVCYWLLLDKDGVANKVTAQVARWREEGHEAEIFCLTRHWPGRDNTTSWNTVFFDTPAGRLPATRELVRQVRAWRPDAIYLRYDLFLPPVPALIRRVPTAVEINADDRAEARLRRARARLATAYNELNRRVLLSRARGLVCVTHELAESDSFAHFGKPTIVIGNGVDLDVVRPLPAEAEGPPRVAFLGSARQVWHGVDKIVRLAELVPELQIELIGYEPHHLVEAVGDRHPPNLTAHGVLSRDAYAPILARCDAAIGTLALHRKGMAEACPLKVREYLAHGLPTVIAYRDTDLAGLDDWFLHRLPNEEGNVEANVDAIRSFVDGVRGRRVPREAVAERIGTEAKERRRLAFLAELREQTRSASR